MTLLIRRLAPADSLTECLKIRHKVFVIEQHVPIELEVDGLDPDCWHYLGKLDEKAVATARVCFPEQDVAKIQRVAVLPACQGKGIGLALMQYILSDLTGKAAKAKLDSQTHAQKFYEKLGFQKIGAEFMDAGIPHCAMWLTLK